jgi:hypothetical protein
MSKKRKPLRVASQFELWDMLYKLDSKWSELGLELSVQLFGLISDLLRQQHFTTDEKHMRRYLLVCEGRSQGLTFEQSYAFASRKSMGEPGQGEPDTMRMSYRKIQKARRSR